jgi:hypothetical protein
MVSARDIGKDQNSVLTGTLSLTFSLLAFFLAVRKRFPLARILPAAAAEFLLLAALCETLAWVAPLSVRLPALLLCALLYSLDYRYYDRLGACVDACTVLTTFKEPEHASIIVRHEFGRKGWDILACMSACATITALVTDHVALWVAAALAASGAVTLGITIWSANAPPPANAALPPLLNFIWAAALALRIALGAKPKEETGIHQPDRYPVRRKPGDPSRNILLIVCESLAERVLYSRAGREAAPRYHRFLAANSRRLTDFPCAFSNSSASDVSYPSIFTGLSPEASNHGFHRDGKRPVRWIQSVFRKAMSALRSSVERFNPKTWPLTAKVSAR